MLSLQQFLVFEIAAGCNLSREHAPLCPSSNPLRWANVETPQPLSDVLILACCREAYNDLGFRGQVAWHYYCEPMLAWPRLQGLMPLIRREIPAARFCLWTNGTIMPHNPADLQIFDSVWISNYHKKKWSAVRAAVPDTHVLDGNMDDRTDGQISLCKARCLRPFNELVIDHYGNVRLCCMDWRGEVPIGNVWEAPFAVLARHFIKLREILARSPMPLAAPTVCRACAWRSPQAVELVAPVYDAIVRHVDPCRS